MDRRLLSTFVNLLGVVALAWATILFLGSPNHGISDVLVFAPALLSFVLGWLFGQVHSLGWLAKFDPWTLVFLVAALVVMAIGLRFLLLREKETADTLFSWGFNLLTFVAGLEVGRQRRQRDKARESRATKNADQQGGRRV